MKYLQENSSWDQLLNPIVDAINKSTIKTEVTIDDKTKKIVLTAIFTLSAALVISALINHSKKVV